MTTDMYMYIWCTASVRSFIDSSSERMPSSGSPSRPCTALFVVLRVLLKSSCLRQEDRRIHRVCCRANLEHKSESRLDFGLGLSHFEYKRH